MDLFLRSGSNQSSGNMAQHALSKPSEWICRWSDLVSTCGTVLDVACGYGRHMKWFQSRGCAVFGVDQSTDAVLSARQWGTVAQADIEHEPWPYVVASSDGVKPQQFDAVVVCNYLWRPLLSTLLACVKTDGLILYETFSAGNETVGRPRNPDFLLRPGELLHMCLDFRIIAYEDVYLPTPERYVQRIVAQRVQSVA